MTIRPFRTRYAKIHLLCAIAFYFAQCPELIGRPFEDKFGRTINADLTGHWGLSNGFIQIDMSGKQRTVAIDSFASKHRPEIEEWIAKNTGKLVPRTAEKGSGEGLISGSKWLYIRKNGSRIDIEFRGAGALTKDGVVSRSGKWEVREGKHLSFRWSSGARHVFSKRIIAEQIYLDSFDSALVKLNRLPVKIGTATFANKSYLLFRPSGVDNWLGRKGSLIAILNFDAAGKASVDNSSVSATWKVSEDEDHLAIIRSDGKKYTFTPKARDTLVDKYGYVLLELRPPKSS